MSGGGTSVTFVQGLLGLLTFASIFIGGIVAWRKVGPERQKGIAEAAEKVALASASFIETQRTEITSLRERVAYLEGREVQVREQEARLHRMKAERDAAEQATEVLLERLEELLEVMRQHSIEPPAHVTKVVLDYRQSGWRTNAPRHSSAE